MISIIIPTFNNIDYLKLCISSLEKNSYFSNQILVHVNEGTDGTIDFLKQKKITYTHSTSNIGLCKACNMISRKSTLDYILYAHDDMYFLPNWDVILINKTKKIGHKKFYLSSIMINGDPKLNGHLNLHAGDNFKNFDENFLLNNYQNLKHNDFQGSTWAPHLIHKELWEKVGGFSEEFSPGAGSDPDLNMKLWNEGVRIFKGLNDFKVYHFGSLTTRKNKNIVQNKGNDIFLKKWGFDVKFFKFHYLNSNTIYYGPLGEPLKDIKYYFDLLLCKIKLFYLNVFKHK